MVLSRIPIIPTLIIPSHNSTCRIKMFWSPNMTCYEKLIPISDCALPLPLICAKVLPSFNSVQLMIVFCFRQVCKLVKLSLKKTYGVRPSNISYINKKIIIWNTTAWSFHLVLVKKKHMVTSRHEIRKIEIQEKQIANVLSAKSFVEDLKTLLEEKGHDLDFVCNADETCLNCKALPSKLLASRKCSTRLQSKVMVSANVTGTHWLPLLFTGKSKNPRWVKNVKIPLTYTYQQKTWMNKDIFLAWYEKTLLPEVKKFQKDVGIASF